MEAYRDNVRGLLSGSNSLQFTLIRRIGIFRKYYIEVKIAIFKSGEHGDELLRPEATQERIEAPVSRSGPWRSV